MVIVSLVAAEGAVRSESTCEDLGWDVSGCTLRSDSPQLSFSPHFEKALSLDKGGQLVLLWMVLHLLT